ncbi:MAG: cobalt ECF transporter T component CbiQ [Chloroflexi bacterium]|nr:cobalt ECF transporter T component CbiQ [Chloroflexota bacterium]
MNPFPIDAYAYGNRLSTAHPGEKLLFAGATLLICLGAQSVVVSLLVLLLMLLTLRLGAGIPYPAIWSFWQTPLAFILMSALTLAVVGVSADTRGILAAVPIGPWQLGITEPSLREAIRVFAVSLASVSAGLFLSLTTPLVDLTDQLRRWHVPALFVELMVLVYRFVFVLLETVQAIHTAQDARLGYSSWPRAFRSLGSLTAALYGRAHARAAALFVALSARGYTGELQVLVERRPWSRTRLVLIGATEALLLAAAVATWLTGGA